VTGLKIETMIKKTVLIASLTVFLYGCNLNPSKEARIQKLETDIEQSLEKIGGLETRVQILESQNKKLQAKLQALEAPPPTQGDE